MNSPEPQTAKTQAGTLDEALANGRQMLRARPDMALVQAHTILRRDGRNPEAFRLAAAAHRALGETDQAERAELAAIQHSQHVPALVAAAKALDEGRPGEASRLAADHLRAMPEDLAAITLSAESALALGLPDKAEPLLRMVLARAPLFLAAKMLLVNTLMRQDKLQESRAVVEELLALRPSDEAALRLLARIQSELGRQEEAASVYERLLKTSDRSADLWLLYGDALRFLGRKVDSRLAYRRALSLNPDFGQAWWSLVNLDPAAASDEDMAQMRDAMDGAAGKPEHLTNLHFALATAFDARRQHTEAFEHFRAGNALRRSTQPYEAAEISGQVARYIEAFPAGTVALPPRAGTGSAAPIFIVGMPRSGSTLVERILGRHSTVEALGELPLVPHIVESLKLEQPEAPVERRIAELSPDRLAELAQRYRDRASERRATDRPFYTDKLHMNWRHLPLILRMLPDARIIDVRRSAMDCCWSNYKLLARGHPASADLSDLGRFFADYIRFLDHIEAIAPGRIHRVRYERLVDDLEGETRSMLAWLDLSFEPECLDFHLSEGPVATASSEQVRRPLNREGIGSWRPYAEWLEPLRTALGWLADD